MNAARWPKDDPTLARLLHVELATGRMQDRRAGDLPLLLAPGDLLVVNDAATLPASLFGRVRGRPIELRLLAAESDGMWRAVLFGAGDWHTPTERRPPPPRVMQGDELCFKHLHATVDDVLPESPRLLRVRFEQTGAGFWSALYREASPVQYAYLKEPLALWHVQTAYTARPWAMEAPSAGYPLTGAVLIALRQRGVSLASLTHAAGLSSTGDEVLDASLPLDERFDLPKSTIAAIAQTRQRGGRVVAVGTTVVRALEGCALEHGGELVAGEGQTALRIGPGYRRRIVDGLLTGMHEPTASHYALLQAFAPRRLLDEAHAQAEALGYLGHEFGDACLLL